MRRSLPLLIILGLVVILLFWGCGSYNGLVQQDETVKNSWNKVQSDYQRRADLIPNLVRTVHRHAHLFVEPNLQGSYKSPFECTADLWSVLPAVLLKSLFFSVGLLYTPNIGFAGSTATYVLKFSGIRRDILSHE